MKITAPNIRWKLGLWVGNLFGCLLFLLCACVLLACEQRNAANPPIELPFSLNNVDNEINIPLKINDPGGYRIALKMFYAKDDEAERERLYRMFDTHEKDEFGNFIKNGLPVEISIQISSVGVSRAFSFSKIVERAELYAHGDGYYSLQLDSMSLSSGEYQVKMKNLKTVSNLGSSSSAILIASSLRK
jgi:hypothetical protein